ncbi:MAG: cyclic nucleotide-binding domain-containing protein [Pseudomonadota bacterium]
MPNDPLPEFIAVPTADLFGYVAAALVFATFCMKTMPALRGIAVASNLAFIAYGLLADLAPVLVLHGALLPLNLGRLASMRRDIRLASEAAAAPADADFRWLASHAEERDVPEGVFLFEKGEEASSLFVVLEGRVDLPEVGVSLTPGDMFGEVALFSADRRRTASAVAGMRTRVAELSERRVQQLYFDNPKFAYRLIRLITGRLVTNLQRAEGAAGDGAALHRLDRAPGEDGGARERSGAASQLKAVRGA